jgi:MFS family permease
MAAGVFLSLIPLVANVSTYTGILILSVITGVTFGFGIPACLGYFAASTEAANRGRLGGITFLLIGVGAYLLSLMGNNNTTLAILILATWKIVGVVLLFALKPEETNVEQKHKIPYSFVLDDVFVREQSNFSD